MSPALEAHLRLLATLPVRTHLEKQPPPIEKRYIGGRKAKTPEHIRQLIMKYRAEGWRYKAIKRELRVSCGTISKVISSLR